MALASLLSCCGIGRRRHDEEADERTALLDPNALPRQQAQPVAFAISTEEEVRHQGDLRKIVDEASARIISINAQAPLLQVQTDIPISPRGRRASEDRTTNSAISWRAVNGDTPAPNGRLRPPKGTDASAHSLRTFHQANEAPKRKSKLVKSEAGSDDDADSSGYGTVKTMRTYRTAEEPASDGEDDAATERGSVEEEDGVPPIQSELVEVIEAEDVFMQEAVAKLEASLTLSFDLGTSLPSDPFLDSR